MAHPWCAISRPDNSGAPGSAPLLCPIVRHYYASQGAIFTFTYASKCAITMPHNAALVFSLGAPLMLNMVRHYYEYQELLFFAFLLFAQVTKYVTAHNINITQQNSSYQSPNSKQRTKFKHQPSLGLETLAKFIILAEFVVTLQSRYRSSKLPSHRRELRSR